MSYFARSDELPGWAANVPEDWGKGWLKWSVNLSTKRPTDSEQETLPYISNEDIASWTGKLLVDEPKPAEVDSRMFQKDDVLFNKLRPYLAKVYHATFDGVSSGELLCLRPSRAVEPRFLFYVLVSKGFIDTINSETFGSKMPRADWETVGHQPLPLPPRETQQRIARFLDEKTARIDGLIEKKRALLDRLAEKRQAIITRAVTKGLNPAAPLKPSGIDWLGDIPAHWEVAPMWTAIHKLESGVSVNAMDVPTENDQLGVLKTSAVYSGVFDPNENKTVYDEFEAERLSCPVRRGEIIISRMNTPDLVGASGLVVDDYPNLFLPDRLWQTKFGPTSKAIPTYIYLFLNSRLFRAIIASRATGTSGSMQNISQNDLLKIKVAIPPKDEQKTIAAEVTDILADITNQCGTVQRSIDVLNEYRAALITAAVTGQVADLA